MPQNTYEKLLEQYLLQLKKINQKLLASSLIRLAVFLIFAFLIYYFFGQTKLVLGSIAVGIALFLFLVSRHSDLQHQKEKIQKLIEINQTELRVLKRDFHDLPDGKEFTNPQHAFSQDIDLFGPRSFFQYLNRTALASGKQKLANLLVSNKIEEIVNKQNSIQELSEKIDFRQEFTAVAKMVKAKIKTPILLNWLKNHKSFVPSIFKWLPKVFSVFSVFFITLYILDFIHGWYLGGWFILGWIIIGKYSKRINSFSQYLGEVQSTFHQYYLLLSLIEELSVEAKINKEQQERIRSEEKKGSTLLKEFSKNIDALEQKNVMIFGQLLSGFTLWDLWKAYELEQWIIQHRNRVENWFEVIDYFDAYNSLGNFAFNHQNYVFPTINDDDFVLKTTEAVHPLINPQEAVTNNYSIQKESFFIVTGANMAGKSTFLRTVSLQIMMANVGLPVCAETCSYSPIKLITSMRTVDSLADEASYFFAELTRLKFIVEEIKTDRFFIILDEILKGTNSTDKALGSQKFIEKLVASNSTGIIATHDLSLCQVADEFQQVKNYYFDAEIINNELHFDYQLKDGICQNMNASFLLKKMGIVNH